MCGEDLGLPPTTYADTILTIRSNLTVNWLSLLSYNSQSPESCSATTACESSYCLCWGSVSLHHDFLPVGRKTILEDTLHCTLSVGIGVPPTTYLQCIIKNSLLPSLRLQRRTEAFVPYPIPCEDG
jgi:hypothetical protein